MGIVVGQEEEDTVALSKARNEHFPIIHAWIEEDFFREFPVSCACFKKNFPIMVLRF